jgi:hypothetical protein
MRFGRWSAAQPTTIQNASGSKVLEVAKKSKKSEGINIRESQNGIHRRERSRYDIPEQRKRPTTTPSKKPSLHEEIVTADFPIIDRIPTAIGYQSDGSDEEWLEEKSRCSRYATSEHGDIDDEVSASDMAADENRDEDDIGDDGDDKYSQMGAKAKINREKTTSHRDTISALWSQSTDSETDTDKDKWHISDANLNAKTKMEAEESISYAEEKGTDPIYDKNQGKQTKNKRAKAPHSPAGISDTSSVSDNLQKMLHFASTNDEAVPSIEGHIQILKETAAEEYGQRKKKISRKLRRAEKTTKMSEHGTTPHSKDQIEMARSASAQQAKSKDEIELSRTVSLPETAKASAAKKIKGKKMPEKLNGTDILVPERMALPVYDFSDVESTKSGRQSHAMYTKSLLTEDSDNDTQQIPVLPDPVKSKEMKQVARDESRTTEATLSKKHRIGILLSNSWNLAGTARSKLGQKKIGKADMVPQSSGFFSKLRKQRKINVEKKNSLNTGNIYLTEVSLPTVPISPRSKQSIEPKELDEYSRSTKETNHNEPDVVQCLRYFQCGSVANHVNVAITVANCGPTHENVASEEEDDTNDILDATPVTPKPTVEVYLNDERKTGMPQKREILSCGSSLSCKNESPEDDDLTEVPALGLSRASSIIIDVTGMQLHLDGDTETDRKLSSIRGVGGSNSRSDVSVTSITVPVLTSSQSDSNEGTAEETELELKDYMQKINKRKGIRGFFMKLTKKQ